MNKQLRLTEHKNQKHSKSKLDGFSSLNTSTNSNPFCQSMLKSDAICKHCYASRLEKQYFSRTDKLTDNSQILSDSIMLWDHVPYYPLLSVLRLHSLGELINDIHFINFLLICRKNSHCTVSLWTKRKDIIKRVFKSGYEKPDNLILIYSNPVINPDFEIKTPEFFDKVFNNFTSDFAKSELIDVNCYQSCKDCMICYQHNDINQVNELVKLPGGKKL